MNRILDTAACTALLLLSGFTGWPPADANVPCERAGHRTYQRGGIHYEAFYLDGQFIFENQIFNQASHTRTHPGWVLQDDGRCNWQGTPPARIAGLKQLPSTIPQPEPQPTNTEPQAMTTQTVAPGEAEGGALLILLGVVGTGIYAAFQRKNNKPDFADDYHPMSDAPQLPTVYTDEHLDNVYDRHLHPQYQGITEPNPWGQRYAPPLPPNATTPPPPPGSTYVPPVESTDSTTGGMEPVDPKQHFELTWLPAPSRGYFLGEESVLSSSSQARNIVRDAINAGVSVNFLMTHVFKISKNSKKHELLKELVTSVSQELG